MKMMKRTLCLVLALVMLVGMFTLSVGAEELTIVDGTQPTPSGIASFYLYGKYPNGETDPVLVHADNFTVANYATLAAYVDAVTSYNQGVPAGYELDRSTMTDSEGNTPAWNSAVQSDTAVRIYANLKAIENEPDNLPPEVTAPAAPQAGTEFEGAVVVSCDPGWHKSVAFDWSVPFDWTSSSDKPEVRGDEVDGYYISYIVDKAAWVKEFDKVVWGFHKDNTLRPAYVTLKYNATKSVWELYSAAAITAVCQEPACGWWHKHTVTYTDGVRGAVVFKDITYTVKHGEKTPVPATPVRAGYKFAGWSPAVSYKTTKCVTYYATWVEAKGPSLTKEHVAYLKGYGKGLVKPEGEITRAEAITMLYRLMDKASVKEYYTTYNAFSDVAKDAWYNDAVSTLANAGVLRYKTGLLNPNEAITRAEFFYMLTKFSNVEYTGKCTFVDVPSTYWAYEELTLAQYLGWIKGYGGGVLYPDDTITRAEVAASLNRVLGRTACKVKDTKNFIDNPVNAWYYDDIVEASIAH